MKILHISASDSDGGAAIGALNLHRAMRDCGLNSYMWVRKKNTNDPYIEKKSNIPRMAVAWIVKWVINRLTKGEGVYFSANLIPSDISRLVNQSDFDLINIHWVGGESFSIEDISRIKKPIVWTLRDMWPFCGAEHYADDSSDSGWVNGYKESKRLNLFVEKINFYVWLRKYKSYRNIKSLNLVALSNWLADCASKSPLFDNRAISVLPNVIDLNEFKPYDKVEARKYFNFPIKRKIVLCGAVGGANDPRKGYSMMDFVQDRICEKLNEDVLFVYFGGKRDVSSNKRRIDLGYIESKTRLAKLYSAADVMAVPSRQEAFGKTAAEPQACGCPVVAYATTGLVDVVQHGVTGYLAEPFNEEDFAAGLIKILSENEFLSKLGKNARQRSLDLWSPSVVVGGYVKLYGDILNANRI